MKRERYDIMEVLRCKCVRGMYVCEHHGGPRVIHDAHLEADINAIVYGDPPMPDIPPTDSEVWSFYIEMWRGRIENHYDNAIVIDGNVGSGKSSCGLQIGLDLTNQELSLETDVIYNLEILLDRLYRSKPGDVVVADEAILVAQATAGGSKEVYILERAMALSRELGVTLILIIPNIHSLAKGMRERRAEFWIHVEERGVATVHQLTKAIQYRTTDLLPFVKMPEPYTTLRWSPFPASDSFWVRYSKLKHERTLEEIARSRDEVAGKDARGRKHATRPQKLEKQRARMERYRKRHKSVTGVTNSPGVKRG